MRVDYTYQYTALMKLLREGSGRIPEEGNEGIRLHHVPFRSEYTIQLNSYQNRSLQTIFSDSPGNMMQNSDFVLPILRPSGEQAKKRAIILLHGLNERSWDKYMPWAWSLAQQTGKSIILFPIAYHMNRSPESWKDPRQMIPYVSQRTRSLPGLQDSSYLNIALSERITNQPQRFFLSGYQAAQDIINLMDELRNGKHPLFEKDTCIDFFAYSIGVLLAEVMLLANPEKRFSQSKFVFFCGGSVLEGMRGESKYILDTEAFTRLSVFYRKSLEEESKKAGLFSDLLSQTQLGQAFMHLTSFRRLAGAGKKFILHIQDQVQTICLGKDKVMPVENVKRTLAGTKVIELDLPYPYSHEVPFPLRPTKIDDVVDRAFGQIFSMAGAFLRK